MRGCESGVALVNVLTVVALGSAVLIAMTAVQDLSINRSRSYSEAAQAMEIAFAGEASAVAALRRDAIETPDLDHAAEAWGAIADREADIEGGTFTLSISDAQNRFNLRNIDEGALVSAQFVERMSEALEREPQRLERLAPGLSAAVEARDVSALVAFAKAMPEAEQLFTELPVPTDVNINAASELLLAALFANEAMARRVVALRERQGYVTGDDLRRLGVIPPPGTGFTSDFFRVRVAVEYGSVRQVLETLLWRQHDGSSVAVVPVQRRYGEAAVP